MASKLCCKKCSYTTSHPDKLFTHLKNVHGYIYPECDFKTTFERSLQLMTMKINIKLKMKKEPDVNYV